MNDNDKLDESQLDRLRRVADGALREVVTDGARTTTVSEEDVSILGRLEELGFVRSLYDHTNDGETFTLLAVRYELTARGRASLALSPPSIMDAIRDALVERGWVVFSDEPETERLYRHPELARPPMNWAAAVAAQYLVREI